MLDKIKAKLFENYKHDDVKWMFFSLFDKNNNLIISNWVFQTDKNISDLTDVIYNGLLSKQSNGKTIVVDIIIESRQENDINKILSLSPKEYWFFLINNEDKKSWVILPNMKWVQDTRSALSLIKQKFWLGWNVLIHVFKTNRIVIQI